MLWVSLCTLRECFVDYFKGIFCNVNYVDKLKEKLQVIHMCINILFFNNHKGFKYLSTLLTCPTTIIVKISIIIVLFFIERRYPHAYLL